MSYEPFAPPPRILMGPGPAAVDPRVLAAMSHALLGHLDPSFLAVMDDVREMLRKVFRTGNQTTLAVSGTGTASMEAALVNVIEPGDGVVVGVAGYFGARMAEIARRCGGRVTIAQSEWGTPVPAVRFREALARAAAPVKAVALVHAETSTGVLQPLDEVVELAHAAGALVVLDAVTSLGGIDLALDEIGGGVDVCYSGSQK